MHRPATALVSALAAGRELRLTDAIHFRDDSVACGVSLGRVLRGWSRRWRQPLTMVGHARWGDAGECHDVAMEVGLVGVAGLGRDSAAGRVEVLRLRAQLIARRTDVT